MGCGLKLLEKLLTKLYKEVVTDPQMVESWYAIWGPAYCEALRLNKHLFHYNTSQAVHTVITNIRLEALPVILLKVFT